MKTKTKMMKLSDLKVPADAKINEHLTELLRKAYSGEDTHQADKVAHLAALLGEEARDAGKDFGRLHAAVMAFVTALDGTVAEDEDECVGVLGDTEFAQLFLESLHRRGKNDPRYAALLLRHAREMLAAQSGADEASEAINEALTGGGSIWTLNQGDGTVSRCDEKSRKVIATVQVGIPGTGGDIGYGADSIWLTVFDVPLTRVDATTNRGREAVDWQGRRLPTVRFRFTLDNRLQERIAFADSY